MSAASTKVICTYELLERILSYLSFRDLLVAQQVSTQFSSFIQRSVELQQTLFRSPARKTAFSEHPFKAAVFDFIDDYHDNIRACYAPNIAKTLRARIKYIASACDYKERYFCSIVFATGLRNYREHSLCLCTQLSHLSRR